MEHSPFFLLLSTVLLLLTATPGTHSQPAAAPAPPGPTNVTKILEKAGQFTVFIRLLKSTGVANQLYGQLNNSDNGITIFAPSDSSFSSLKAGTLNSLSDEQQVELIHWSGSASEWRVSCLSAKSWGGHQSINDRNDVDGIEKAADSECGEGSSDSMVAWKEQPMKKKK
ncbi:hypothetical protein F2Q70_00007760 [Brassica cretica]|uniref:FAS1 domain-containing protein n=1 Tax=Brassica cretica TaxID=69181 RepID=A0A8S9M3M5_BRACR|nr:hypothetical protein F2Q70_00007760 [Brassica cretica]